MNANDQLRDYSCTDNYYRHPLGLIFTDGVKALCEKFECWWLLDIIASYQRDLTGEDFQVWKLNKNEDDSAVVTCTDGNGRVIRKQEIEYTDFAADEASVWVEHGTALLPSEH